MTKGAAKGVNRKYQELCREVLTFRDPELIPWSGDGIDVPFDLDDTCWTLDVALRASDGSAVVAECKRHKNAIKQGNLAELAWKVERLRGKLGVPVAAFCFAKNGHQAGSVRVGVYAGIEVVELEETAIPPAFRMVFYRYDTAREEKLRDRVLHVAPGRYSLKAGEAKLIYAKSDGTTETR